MASFTTLHAYYAADVPTFLAADSDLIYGQLSKAGPFAVETTQRDAWISQIEILKQALRSFVGTIFLEFNVPRIGTRLDAAFVSASTIFVLEFKAGEHEFGRGAINQVWDYGLDLKNFHKASHHASIRPVLIATEAPVTSPMWGVAHSDGVYPPVCCNKTELASVIAAGLIEPTEETIDPEEWGNAPYQPTPTIIEAAQSLYAQHSVEAISRHDAGARNLKVTSVRVEEIIEEARKAGRKAIIFVTGVPGAGKTLVGLNVATKKRDQTQPTHAVFLSGNGPLVEVLTEALTRDEVQRLRNKGEAVRKGPVKQKVKAFIQNVHHFRDAGLRDMLPPADHVVIFDEAQRAWDRQMTADFMARKKGRAGFSDSEPEFLISYLDRHDDWAVVICLVGGGQEINRGEAGISAWLDAVRERFPEWLVYVSPELTDTEYAAGHTIELLSGRGNVLKDKCLHLAASMRSFRAENVSNFVKAVLECDATKARDLFGSIAPRYPLALTRDLQMAKQWIREHARGSERFGLVASSEAQRLKPHAIDIRVEISPIHWFLSDADDTRSSFYLEDAATEFQVQGLELDWTCVNWDADLRFHSSRWSYHSFVGSNWNNIKKPERQQYLRNAYRVLLTRARQGMVVFVPQGEPTDPTRDSSFYDQTFTYLSNLGIPLLVS